MQVSLKNIHNLVDVERGMERGGAEVNPESHQRMWCFWGHLADRKIMEGKVGWLAELEPLSHSVQDEELILFC